MRQPQFRRIQHIRAGDSSLAGGFVWLIIRQPSKLIRSIFAVVLLVLVSQPIRAHDGHAPLPTKGATVEGNQLLLSEKARKSIGVMVEKITLANLERSVPAQCQIRLPWHHQAQVSTLLPGRIMKVLARPGDKVEKDQVLAEITSLEFETIQRDLLKSVSTKKFANRLLEQRETLAKNNTISSELLFETRRQSDESAAEVEIANRKLLALGLNQAAIDEIITSELPVKRLSIRSPIKGEVASADAETGKVVSSDASLFQIVDLTEVEFVGEVIETDVPAVKIGQTVKASFTALREHEFEGFIEHTELEVDERLHTLKVIAHAKNRDRLLKPGMSGRMRVIVARAEQAIVCPISAISGSPSVPIVFLERSSNRYDRREVKLGMRVGKQVEILDGLFPGDRVVVVGAAVMSTLMPQLKGTSEKNRKPQFANGLANPVEDPVGDGVEEVGQVVALGEVEVPIDRRHFATSQVEGKIARILVHPGQDVSLGQVLAEVASLPVFELQLKLLQNQAQARWLREKKWRLQSLESTQAVRKIDLWQAETDLEVLEHKIEELRSQLKSIGFEESTIAMLEANGLDPAKRDMAGMMVIPIRSPASGRLDHFELVPGQMVNTATDPFHEEKPDYSFEIHDRSRMWVRAYIRESEAGRVQLGQSAALSFPALPGKSFSGRVLRISPIFDSVSRVMPIWVELDNSSGQLFENMQAKVAIETKVSEHALPVGLK